MRSWILVLHNIIFCLLLGGCLMGPNYKTPKTVICDAWTSDTAASNNLFVSLCEAPPIAWWELFNDPLLNRYIEMAALHNNDILAAEASICKARGMRQVTAAALFPRIAADMSATRTYFSKNGPVLGFASGESGLGPIAQGPRIPNPENIYNAFFDACWEIDFFGKRRRAVEAANAAIGSAIEDRNDILITILAEVAMNYMELRSNQNRGVLIEENIGLLEKNVMLVAKQFEVGYRNQLDVQRIEAELAQAVADLPNVLAMIYQNIYALSVLTGNLPEVLLTELLPIQPLPCLPQQIAMGIRSDLLRRRPDVRRAERQLAQATANIGVAVASFFPSFTLFGFSGLQSIHLSNLFQAHSLTWLLGGDLHIPIFEGGRLTGNLCVNKAQAASAAFTYQQTILKALEEAESGLIAYSEQLQTTEDLTEAAFKYENLVFLTNERFVKGLVSVTDLLDVERQWNLAEQNLLTSATTALIDLIRLYKALGGGWEPAAACL